MDAMCIYVDDDRGDTIVMIHGFARSLHTWDGVADELKREHRVIRRICRPSAGPVRCP